MPVAASSQVHAFVRRVRSSSSLTNVLVAVAILSASVLMFKRYLAKSVAVPPTRFTKKIKAIGRSFSFRVVEGGKISSAFTKITCSVATETDPISFAKFITLLKTSERFRSQFNDAVASLPYDAFFFECPPIYGNRADKQSFEFVGLPAPSLRHAIAQPSAFPQIKSFVGKVGALTFPNLGGDAVLIVPSLYPADADYAHLALLTRQAPEKQRQVFWSRVADALEKRVLRKPSAPVWFSTSGLGIFWTHVRLDSRPKYYTHGEYRDIGKVSREA